MYKDYDDHNGFESCDERDVSYLVDMQSKTENEVKEKFDSFLDSYSFYLKKKSLLSKKILERKVIELELIDPNFDFNIE